MFSLTISLSVIHLHSSAIMIIAIILEHLSIKKKSRARASRPDSSPPRKDDSREYWINANPLNRLLVVVAYRFRSSRLVNLVWKEKSLLDSIGNICIIKVSNNNKIAEAHNIRFVSENTTVPVPRIYCAFVRKGKTYIVESRIRGHDARWGWIHRSEESKARILHQLRGMVEQIHNIPRPDGEAGVASAIGGPVYDPRLPGDPFWGPFPSLRDFNRALLNDCCDPYTYTCTTAASVPVGILDMMEWFKRQPDELLVFSHGDLSSLNIMVDGDKVTGIVDWEMAGWFPPYWDYVNAWHANFRNLWWQNEVDKFMTPRPDDLEMDGIRRRHFG
jgi:aminoglycoside phosphotransferase